MRTPFTRFASLLPARSVTTAPVVMAAVLMSLAGCMTDLPSDLARNHDHYIHGTPKR